MEALRGGVSHRSRVSGIAVLNTVTRKRRGRRAQGWVEKKQEKLRCHAPHEVTATGSARRLFFKVMSRSEAYCPLFSKKSIGAGFGGLVPVIGAGSGNYALIATTFCGAALGARQN